MLEINDSFQHSFKFSQAEVVQFAQVTGDNNPIHLDTEYAQTTAFKQPIMHGFLGGSIFSKVFGTMFPGEGSIYLKQSMEFLRPMFVDTEYEATFIVKDINRDKHRATFETIIRDKATQKETIRGEALIMHATKI
ncbi:MAG: MaoC family dehydratase [Microscillaceae bacterium]|nr:MaoC family dehydratase [Microscillaceae bacterium]